MGRRRRQRPKSQRQYVVQNDAMVIAAKLKGVRTEKMRFIEPTLATLRQGAERLSHIWTRANDNCFRKRSQKQLRIIHLSPWARRKASGYSCKLILLAMKIMSKERVARAK